MPALYLQEDVERKYHYLIHIPVILQYSTQYFERWAKVSGLQKHLRENTMR